MRWNKKFGNNNVRDTRGSRNSQTRFRGAGGRSLLSFLPVLFRFLGFKGTLIVGIVAGGIFFLKPDLFQTLLSATSQNTTQSSQVTTNSPEDQETILFIQNTVGSINATWPKLMGSAYRPPSLDLVNDHKGTGPYYMPSNEKIYLDPQFFHDLAQKYGAPGDFAHAYVIAHEGAHHVQKILGLTDFVHQKYGAANYNQLSVRLELSADFLAGVWAHHAIKNKDFSLDEGDLEEAIRAARQIGDDALQKKAGARNIDPSKFTHGTSEQRMAWLRYGIQSGNMKDCDLFIISKASISLGNSLFPPGH